MQVRLALMVAIAANGVIGRDNALPWHLPGDLRHFRRTTMGKPVIMGRRTFASIGKPLPGRTNIVVSQTLGQVPAGAALVPSLGHALELGRQLALAAGVEEVVVIGGARLYAEALPLADRLYLTEVHAEYEGDTWFPPVDLSSWRELWREEHEAAGCAAPGYAFVLYERR